MDKSNKFARTWKVKRIAGTDKDSVAIRMLLTAKRITGYLSKACILVLDAHLCKIIKEVTGFTLNEYITNRRIIRATELLRNYGLWIKSEISIPVFFISNMKKLSSLTNSSEPIGTG